MPYSGDVLAQKKHAQSATYNLASIKATFTSPSTLNCTASSRNSARALGLQLSDMVAVVQATTVSHFYKTMPSHQNPAIFQDVYHVPFRQWTLYVKFTIDADGHLLISLKEK